MQKRSHLVNVMGLNKNSTDIKVDGKRSDKSLELVGLLKLVNDQARGMNGSPRKPYHRAHPQSREARGTKSNSSSSTTPVPKSSASSSSKPSASSQSTKPTPTTAKAPVKKDGSSANNTNSNDGVRCHRCRKKGHIVRDCPYPHDNMDRRVVLRRENGDAWKERKKRIREEGRQNPTIKTLHDKRRRLTRALNRERKNVRMQ